MNILLNLYPVRSGGGQQVSLTFIKMLVKNDCHHNWYILTGKGSEADILTKKLSIQRHLSLRYSYLNRLLNRNKIKQYVIQNNIDIVYNFGPVLPDLKLPQVVRSVYSNLYYPEIDFWENYPFITRLFKKLKDRARLNGTLSASGLIFENKSMQIRSNEIYGYNLKNTVFIMPSISEFEESDLNDNRIDGLKLIKEFKILYLSTWHLNKNFQILPSVAKELKNKGCKVMFILTLSLNDSKVRKYLYDKIIDLNVEDYFEFIDNVDSKMVGKLIKNVDSMILLSKLECFSSNIIESIYFEKPIIISDEEWSRSVCHNAACYVNRDDSVDISNKIIDIIKSRELYNSIQKESRKLLSQYNTPYSKYLKQVDFLEYIYHSYEKKN